MVTVKLYVEGAAQNNDLNRMRCLEAFSAFFKAAGVTKRPRTIPCGGRKEAYDAFMTAVKSAKSGDLPLLLVDAEDVVAAGHSAWQHLKHHDRWERPNKAKEDQAFLMVQVMETWFLADPVTLRNHFGSGFSAAPFKAWPALEEIPKQTVLDVMARATTRCNQPYQKGAISFKILGLLDTKKVESACPHAKALLGRLRSL